MKSIKEKQLLVKWARAMNEPIDDSLVEEVERYEQIQKEIFESVKKNSINDLTQASKVAEDFVKKINIEYPKPPSLEEVMQVLKEEQNELVQAQTTEVPSPPTPTLASIAAEHITKEALLEKDSFQQPSPPPVDRNLEAVQRKLKFLEQAIGKIAAHGPGSGETRFLNLDDVNYQSWQDRDRHKIVKYSPNTNPAFDEVTFGFLTGDQGPIYSLKYDAYSNYTGNANVGPGLTYYDSERDTLEILHKDGSVTYTGLDNYIRVLNNGSSGAIQRGEFLLFKGVDNNLKVPKVGKFIADANSIPLYSVGVAATEMSNNTLGRAIVLGELENFDATGNTSGEVWNAGDLLWASSSQAGKLTKIQPTAPNVAVSVAAVLDPSPNGKILVRPTIWPRLYYGSFVSTQEQTAANTTSAFAITFDRTEFASGFVIENNSRIKAQHAGLYNFQFSIQFTSTNAASKQIYIFPKKNGISIPDFSTVYTISGNGVNFVPYLNYVVSMEINDYLEIFFGVSDTAARITSPIVPAYSPNIPPVILTVTQVAL